MISVCIPIYNFDVRSLVNILERQISALFVPAEIILIDDGSAEEYKKINRPVCNRKTYIELFENIGRARIRNLFLKYTRYQYLLFLDCDSLIISDNFLRKYISSIEQDQYKKVVCGGRIYNPERPSKAYLLRWKYGICQESQPVEVRSRFSNRSFMSNNFLINRQILTKFPFDERITEYGHEDTLLGYTLKKNGISVRHIDNPVLNGELEKNSEYLKKTGQSIENLGKILDFVEYDDEFVNDAGLLRFYRKIKPIGPILRTLFIAFRPLITLLLKRGYVALWLFDFYKLGLFLGVRGSKEFN